jgi:chromate reductase
MGNEKARILAFAGSLRKGSLNKKTLAAAVTLARDTAEITTVDLAEFPMPVYDGDLEERDGVPEHARRFKALMKSHEGFLICTPEYNSSIPGAFKNVLDWASRPEEGEKSLECFAGKTAALMSASPGALGGMRSVAVLRAMLENIGTMALPGHVSVSKAHEAFNDDGTLKDAKTAAAMRKLTDRLADVAVKLRPAAAVRALIACALLLGALGAAAAPSKTITAELGHEFTLHKGERAKLKGTDAVVRLTGFINSPCPKGARCIWSGQKAILELAVAGTTVPLQGTAAPYLIEVLRSDYKTWAKMRAGPNDRGENKPK